MATPYDVVIELLTMIRDRSEDREIENAAGIGDARLTIERLVESLKGGEPVSIQETIDAAAKHWFEAGRFQGEGDMLEKVFEILSKLDPPAEE